MPALTITPAPFKPSHLSIPPSPHSPLSPLTTTFSRPTPQPTKPIASIASYTTKQESSLSDKPTPANPLPWLWQCHICQRSYPLGVTRRCLDDGHYFCSGEAQSCTLVRRGQVKSKKNKKKHRGKACASEFDYLGWQVYGDWRREELSLRAQVLEKSLDQAEGRFTALKKDCSANCNYPSECRWGKANIEIQPVEAVVAQPLLTTIIEDDALAVPISFEEILGLTPPDMVMDDDVMEDVELTSPLSPPSPQQHDVSFWSSLVNAAKFRKSNKQEAGENLTCAPLDTILEDEAMMIRASDVVIIDHEIDSVHDALSPNTTEIKSPFDLTPPVKRAAANGQPLVPSPLRISKTPSSSSLDNLVTQQSQLGLGISMDDTKSSSK